MRLVFTIAGNKVQNVGYRLFILNSMKEHGLVGYATNLYDGKHVSISAWGAKKDIDSFYSFVQTERLPAVGKVFVNTKMTDNKPAPQSSEIMHEKLDLLIEQTSKFVQHGRIIQRGLGRIESGIRNLASSVSRHTA